MKRICLLLALIIIMAALGACSSNTQNADRLTPTSPNVTLISETGYPIYGATPSVDWLKENSEIIIKCTFNDDAVYSYYDNIWDSGTVDRIWYAVSTITITEVIEGNVSVGDILQIAEPYSYEDKGDGTYNLHYQQMYLPSISHDEYLFFLGKIPDDYKWCAGLYTPMMTSFGRYPIINEKLQTKSLRTMSESDLDLVFDIGALGSIDLYREIYIEVYDEYLS